MRRTEPAPTSSPPIRACAGPDSSRDPFRRGGAGGLSERNLHLTVGTRELTVPGLYQYMVGGGSVEFIRTAGTTPVKGFTFSSKLMEDESHMTLAHPAAFEFMRQFYRAPA